MTDYDEAVQILRETRKAMQRADELIEAALQTKSHPSAIQDMAVSCHRLKTKLEEEMETLQTAINFGGR